MRGCRSKRRPSLISKGPRTDLARRRAKLEAMRFDDANGYRRHEWRAEIGTRVASSHEEPRHRGAVRLAVAATGSRDVFREVEGNSYVVLNKLLLSWNWPYRHANEPISLMSA